MLVILTEEGQVNKILSLGSSYADEANTIVARRNGSYIIAG